MEQPFFQRLDSSETILLAARGKTVQLAIEEFHDSLPRHRKPRLIPH